MAGFIGNTRRYLGVGCEYTPIHNGELFTLDFQNRCLKGNVSSRVAKDHDGNSDFLGRLWFLNCSKLTLGEVATNGRRISAHSRI